MNGEIENRYGSGNEEYLDALNGAEASLDVDAAATSPETEFTDAEAQIGPVAPAAMEDRTASAVSTDDIESPNGSRGNAMMHATATIGKHSSVTSGCPIGRETSIGEGCVIEGRLIGRNVTLGDQVEIGKGCEIGTPGDGRKWSKHEVEIGAGATLHTGVKVKPYSFIGEGTVINSSAKIGYVETKDSNKRINLGRPTIVGANCWVGKKVIIKAGAQIGSGYHIADGLVVPENVKIGNNDSGREIIINQKWIDNYLESQAIKAAIKTQERKAIKNKH